MRSPLTDYRLFLREFRRTFESTGAIMPSGKRLARTLAHFVREGEGNSQPRRILEVGPGTGAVTVAIAEAMRSEDQLDLVELNDSFVERLRERLARDARLKPIADRTNLIHGDVCSLPEGAPYDVIVSGLPLNNFSVPLVENLLAALRRVAVPGGTLSFFEYIAIRRAKAILGRRAERERLRGIGLLLGSMLAAQEVRCDRILLNVPPAWVHHVRFAESVA